jgi:hypothetical protein
MERIKTIKGFAGAQERERRLKINPKPKIFLIAIT